MKKVFSLTMVLALTLALTSIAFAAVPAPGGPFNSAFRVQNLEATQAQCSYVFYAADGTESFTSATTAVNPGDSLYVYVPDLALTSGSYSAVVNCDRQIAAVTNFSDADSGAAHAGVADPGPTWYAPGIYDNYYNYYSDIVVQNASTGAVDVTLEIFEPGNAVAVYSVTQNVPVNGSHAFEQEGLAELDVNVPYSAKISATGNVAAIVNIYGLGGVNNQLYSYNPFKAGATEAYAPVIMNNYYTYDTSLTIQNLGASDAEVTVEYTNGFTTNHTIPSNSPLALYTPGQSGIPAGNFEYGAKVTSTNAQPIVLLVNQSNPYQRAASYTGFSSGSTVATAPFVFKAYYTFDSNVICQNVGTGATRMEIAYATGASGTTTSPSVAAGNTYSFYQPGDPVLASVPIHFQTSATVTSLDGEPIVCVVNYDRIPSLAQQIQDQLYSYEAIAP